MKRPWALYSENDPKAAAWLRELIRADVIVPGEVDERDIRDVLPADLVGFTQCHFFAGIGGWSYALRLAGWPDTREVWTGSCPCQPFSAAGKRAGVADERHLWPVFYRLIAHARPAVLFGEQVASPHGLQWLGAVHADLEKSDYAVGVADLPAAGVGAPHIRQRLFWLAESVGQRRQGIQLHVQPGTPRLHQSEVGGRGEVGLTVGDAGSAGLSQRIGDGCLQRETLESFPREAPLGPGDLVDVADTARDVGGQGCKNSPRWNRRGDEEPGSGPCSGELSGDMANADGGNACPERLQRSGQHRQQQKDCGAGFWADCDWLPCRDSKARPVESGTFPLAHGVPGRVGLLRGYGNAIVPQVAAQFISAYLDILGD